MLSMSPYFILPTVSYCLEYPRTSADGTFDDRHDLIADHKTRLPRRAVHPSMSNKYYMYKYTKAL